MYLQCHVTASTRRRSIEDYVREVNVDVMEYGEEGAIEILLGRFAFQQILWSEIELDGQDAHSVFEEYSDDLEAVYFCFVDEYGDIRSEFQAEAHVSRIVVLDRMVLHPKILKHGQHLLEAALNLFGTSVFVVSWQEVPPLADKSLAELGFRRAAETNFIYRHSSLRRSYEKRYPRGYEKFVDAKPRYEQWVIDAWTKTQ